MLCNSDCMTFWKRQIYRNSKNIGGFRGLGGEREG